MRLVIIPEEGKVGKDNSFYGSLDLSSCSIPPNVRILQWNEKNDNKGWLEFYDGSYNEDIDAIPDWANCCLTKWEEKNYQVKNPPEPTIEEKRALMIVSPFQAKAALLNAGLLTQVESFVNDPAADPLVKLAWNNATQYVRLSPMITTIGAQLGLSDTQLDNLFTAAAQITA